MITCPPGAAPSAPTATATGAADTTAATAATAGASAAGATATASAGSGAAASGADTTASAAGAGRTATSAGDAVGAYAGDGRQVVRHEQQGGPGRLRPGRGGHGARINEGEMIEIDTRDGSYVGRVKA